MLCCTSMKDPFNIADLHFCCSLVWTDTHFQLFSTPLPLQIPKNLIHECSKFSEVCFRWFSEAFLIKQNIFLVGSQNSVRLQFCVCSLVWQRRTTCSLRFRTWPALYTTALWRICLQWCVCGGTVRRSVWLALWINSPANMWAVCYQRRRLPQCSPARRPSTAWRWDTVQ